jgi:energy-coupling factor transporter ATP-binding protein EcfA2
MSGPSLTKMVEMLEATPEAERSRASLNKLATRLDDDYKGKVSRNLHDRGNRLLPADLRKRWQQPSLAIGESFAIFVSGGRAYFGRITAKTARTVSFARELAPESDYLRQIADRVRALLRLRHRSLPLGEFKLDVELLNEPFPGDDFKVGDHSHGLAVAAALTSLWLGKAPRPDAVASAQVLDWHLGDVEELSTKLEALRAEWICTIKVVVVHATQASDDLDQVGASTLVDGVEKTTGLDLGPPTFPWRPLSPYEEQDANEFYGRAAEAEAIVSSIARGKTVVLYGPSGVGKSSLLRAGILPKLKERNWVIHWVNEGSGAPAHSSLVEQDDTQTCVIVDHGEAVDSWQTLEASRQAGAAVLIATRSPEALGPSFANAHFFQLKPLSSDQLFEVLVGPFAPRADLIYEEGAARSLAIDLGARKGGDGTALLGLLLVTLWPKIERGQRISYKDAVDAFERDLFSTQGDVVRRILKRNGVNEDEFTELFVKCLADRAQLRQQRTTEELVELLGIPVPRSMLNLLVATRLFTEVSRDRFELAHDIVLEQWEYLRVLITERHEWLELRDRIERTAERAPSSFWSGEDLQKATAAVAAKQFPLTARAHTFLQNSLEQQRLVDELGGVDVNAGTAALIPWLAPVAKIDLLMAGHLFLWYGERLIGSEYLADPLTVQKLGWTRGILLSITAGTLAAGAFLFTMKIGFKKPGWPHRFIRRGWPLVLGPIIVAIFYVFGGLDVVPSPKYLPVHPDPPTRVLWVIKDITLTYPIPLVVVLIFWHAARSRDIIAYLRRVGNSAAARDISEGNWLTFLKNGYLSLVAAYIIVMGAMLAPDFHEYANQEPKNWGILLHIVLQCALGLATALSVLYLPRKQ